MAIKFLQILSFIALFLMLTNKVHSQDTTLFDIDDFPPNPTYLTYQGDARVLSGNKFLSLAGTEPTGKKKKASVGRVLWSRPIRFWDHHFPPRQAMFDTLIQFRIKPSANGAAEGIAFFIAPVNTTIPEGSVGGNLGIYTGPTDRNIFAVEFDTNKNRWDPVYHHAGINIESRESKNFTRFNAGTGNYVTVRINYNPNNKMINVLALTKGQSAVLKYVFDLKTILPQMVQVGITSSTGLAYSIGAPEITGWYFISILVHATINYEDTYIKQYVQEV